MRRASFTRLAIRMDDGDADQNDVCRRCSTSSCEGLDGNAELAVEKLAVDIKYELLVPPSLDQQGLA